MWQGVGRAGRLVGLAVCLVFPAANAAANNGTFGPPLITLSEGTTTTNCRNLYLANSYYSTNYPYFINL